MLRHSPRHRGLRADGENALAVLEGFVVVLDPLTTALGNQPGIANGLATIADLQSSPPASLTPAQVSVSQQAISDLTSALDAANSALLTAASSINQTRTQKTFMWYPVPSLFSLLSASLTWKHLAPKAARLSIRIYSRRALQVPCRAVSQVVNGCAA